MNSEEFRSCLKEYQKNATHCDRTSLDDVPRFKRRLEEKGILKYLDDIIIEDAKQGWYFGRIRDSNMYEIMFMYYNKPMAISETLINAILITYCRLRDVYKQDVKHYWHGEAYTPIEWDRDFLGKIKFHR